MGGSSELEVINEIKGVVESLTLWFLNNCRKVNPDKFHLLLRDKSDKIDNQLSLEEHVEGLCKKVSQKVSTAARISSLMRFEQRKLSLIYS